MLASCDKVKWGLNWLGESTEGLEKAKGKVGRGTSQQEGTWQPSDLSSTAWSSPAPTASLWASVSSTWEGGREDLSHDCPRPRVGAEARKGSQPWRARTAFHFKALEGRAGTDGV